MLPPPHLWLFAKNWISERIGSLRQRKDISGFAIPRSSAYSVVPSSSSASLRLCASPSPTVQFEVEGDEVWATRCGRLSVCVGDTEMVALGCMS